MMKKHWNTYFLITIVFGGLLTMALQIRSKRIALNDYDGFDLCQTFFGKTCDGTISSAFSVELGFSLVSLALVYFGLIGLLIVLDKFYLNRLALLVSAFGTGTSLLLATLLIVTPLSCSVCLVIHLLIVLSFILIWKITLIREQNNEQRSQKRSIRLAQFSVIIIFLVAGFVTQMILVGGSEGIKHLSSFSDANNQYKNESVVEFNWDETAHILGSTKAPVKLVMISSFQCPGCKTMSTTVKKLKTYFGEDIAINYIHFPLSNLCNTEMEFDMQPQSCAASVAAIAAAKQGKFWEYQDKIFNSNLSLSEEELHGFAQELNLDMKLWEEDRISTSTKQKLQNDIAKGNSIGIYSTPTIYINGKKAPRIDEAFLRYIIQKKLTSEIN